MDSLVKPLLRKWRRLIAPFRMWMPFWLPMNILTILKELGFWLVSTGFQFMPMKKHGKSWQAMAGKIGKVALEQQEIFNTGDTLTFGDLDVMSFAVSHDAAAPQFYSFQREGKQFVMLTDTGYVSDKLRGLLKNADAYLIESNHDLEMLRMGPYAWHLKQRILSDKGHLSNDDGALAMCEMMGDRTKRIYLGHLSQDNNMKEIAYQTAESIFQTHDKGVHQAFELYHTDPYEPTKLFTV